MEEHNRYNNSCGLFIDGRPGNRPPGCLRGLRRKPPSLDAHLSKPNIHIRTPTSIPAQDRSAYSTQEVRSLEEDHRDHFTRAESDTLWAYLLVLDGKFTDDMAAQNRQ